MKKYLEPHLKKLEINYTKGKLAKTNCNKPFEKNLRKMSIGYEIEEKPKKKFKVEERASVGMSSFGESTSSFSMFDHNKQLGDIRSSLMSIEAFMKSRML